jgi:hypothetical protein
MGSILGKAKAAAKPDFSACQTEADIARQLLTQIGIHDDAITPDMVRQAEEANAALLARLIQIAEGN